MSRAEQAARVPSPLKATDARTLLLAGGASPGAAVQKFTFDRVFSPFEVPPLLARIICLSYVPALPEYLRPCRPATW